MESKLNKAAMLAVLIGTGLISGCTETAEKLPAPAGYDVSRTSEYVLTKLPDGGVEITLQNTNCVTRFNVEGALTNATEGADGCQDKQIARAKEIAIQNISNQ
jgi:hypothetical protein